MKSIVKKILSLAVAALLLASFSTAALAAEPVLIGVPDDATNLARAIKLLESAGLIEVDPAAGYSPEIKDITKYVYNIEVMPAAANTLPATLDDYAASIVNGTYAIPAGLLPSRDAILIEQQSEGADNPFANIIVARTAEKDNPLYQTIIAAFQTQTIAEYLIGKYNETFFPAFAYDKSFTPDPALVAEIDAYESDPAGKTTLKIGVCGASNDYINALQKVLDDQNAGIYLDMIEFDAYNLPNEALNNGDIDLNSFQHKNYLNKEIDANGYELTVIGDTLIAPLSLYSRKVASIDELKALAGLAE